ncbi:MAG TPA: hypothetical protein VKM94_24200 [Blastocatellia bacterium]|nr:hypothetical protein [Blastocatellia bacterium]
MINQRNTAQSTLARIAAAAALSAILVALSTTTATMQTRTPYDKERLLKVVRLNALSTQEVVQAVQQRGVDFQLTPAVEAEFKDAGARPELIDALRTNYRATAHATPPSKPSGPSGPTNPTKVPAGAPLSKAEIVTMLQSGVPSERVEQFVEVRGISFAMTPEIAREIGAAGGKRSLLGAISEKATSASTSPSTPSGGRMTGTRVGPDYDELTDQAIGAMQARNPNLAIRLLHQAAQMDSARPTAYQLLGFAQLYGEQNIVSAEQSMRAAMERGGSAVFYVYHDHDGVFKSWCEGSFFVGKTGVSYKAKDGNHTFEAQDSQIKEAAINGFVGSQYGAFHLKLKDTSKDKDKGKTYNFAPATKQKAESNLIVRLIQSY